MTKDQLTGNQIKVLETLHCTRCGEEFPPSALHYVVGYVLENMVISIVCPSSHCRGSLTDGIEPVVVTDGEGRIV